MSFSFAHFLCCLGLRAAPAFENARLRAALLFYQSRRWPCSGSTRAACTGETIIVIIYRKILQFRAPQYEMVLMMSGARCRTADAARERGAIMQLIGILIEYMAYYLFDSGTPCSSRRSTGSCLPSQWHRLVLAASHQKMQRIYHMYSPIMYYNVIY